MTLLQAKKITIEVWSYLRDHPEILKKTSLPYELFAKIEHFMNKCPLCSLYVSRVRECIGCPLADAGECCFLSNSAFAVWDMSLAGEAETRRESASKIVEIVEAWEV